MILSKAVLIVAVLVAAFKYRPVRELDLSGEVVVRSRVVQLSGEHSLCSGIQVHTERGHDYILTAAHCDALADKDGNINAALDGERPIPRRIIENSPVTDLMLLEGMPDLRGLPVAASLGRLDRLTALTHGLGLPTHRSDGEFMLDMSISVLIDQVTSDDERKNCESKSKQHVEESPYGAVCVMGVTETISTIHVDPGSSGGAAVTASGEIAGIVSAGSSVVSCFVTLADIKAFLKSY
jgi:hypothetical protein